MPLKLRLYQEEAVNVLWNALFVDPHALCVLPTGAGKTEVMMEFLARALKQKRDLRVVVLLNKVKLLNQTARRFRAQLGEFSCGVYCGTNGVYDTHFPITIASIQSIFDVDLDAINLLVIDEVHNVNQEDGRYLEFLDRIKTKNAKLKLIGFTATPFRSAGVIYGKGTLFEKITFRRTPRDMMDLGHLVAPRMKKVPHQLDTSALRLRGGEFVAEDVEKLTRDEAKVRAQIEDALPRMEGRKKAVWACSSIAHCELVFRILQEMGEDPCKIHSKMSMEEREEHLDERFESGASRHLVFVSIVSEGYDFPPIDTILLMRPMRSPVLYVQTVGRGLRPAEGKTDCLVLDYGRVIETIGPLDDPRIQKAGERKNQKQEVLMKFCPVCFEYLAKIEPRCPACDYVFVKPKWSLPRLEGQAAEDGEIMKQKAVPKNFDVGSVAIDRYMSKSGNICLKIDYSSKNFLLIPMLEFFVWSNSWAKKRGLDRLWELGIPTRGDETLDELVALQPAKLPTRLTYIMENRYPRILTLHFDVASSNDAQGNDPSGEGARARDPGLLEPQPGVRVEAEHGGEFRPESGGLPKAGAVFDFGAV